MANAHFTCAICLDFESEYPNDDYFVSTKNGHIFHFLCIRQHLCNGENKCPICRENVALNTLTRLHGITLKKRVPPFLSELKESDGTLPSMKIVLLGKASVGKSSILQSLANRPFSSDINSTIGSDVILRNIDVGGEKIRLNLWDTAGTENFHSVSSMTVRGASGIILVYDVTDIISVNEIENWLRFANEYGPEDSTKVLVGNKSDLMGERTVSQFVGQAVADQLGIPFFETSAKSGEHIEAMMRTLVGKILEKPISGHQRQPNTLELEAESEERPGNSCCK